MIIPACSRTPAMRAPPTLWTWIAAPRGLPIGFLVKCKKETSDS